MIRLTIIADKNKKSQSIKKFLLKKTNRLNFNYSKVVIVIGGDGFMLQTLKKQVGSSKFFYGINSGNYGFLMNRFSKKNIFKNLKKIKLIQISPLEMKVLKNNNKFTKSLAINEVSILRQSKQTSSLSVQVGKKKIIKNLISDGVLVSTPAGSTAYNLSVHGPILGLNSKKLSVVPISPFRPRRWKGKIISDQKSITIKNLDYKKRPISAVADNYEVRNAKTIYIKSQKKIIFKLLYNFNRSLEKKIKLEQIKKEIK
jgi:NAD+ kinase